MTATFEIARGNARNGIVVVLPRLMRMSAVSRGILLGPSEAEDDSQPTGLELAPCMDKAATANRESVRDKNFIHRML